MHNRLPRPLLTLLLALPAGQLAAWLHVPLPWMVGPLLLLAALRLRGVELQAPRGGRQAGQWVIGAALGLYFTPAVVHQLAARLPLVTAIAASALVIGLAGAMIIRRLAGTDPATAYFAALPGGASEMAVLAERHGGQVDLVAAAHALRVLLVVVAVPAWLTLAGAHGSDPVLATTTQPPWTPLALLLLGASLAGVALFGALRIANAWVLGPLFAIGLLTACDLRFGALPVWLIDLGQLFIGCALGCRFSPASFRDSPRFMRAAMASALAAMGLSALLALALAALSGLAPATLALAGAPGGVAEMSVTARMLELGVPFVIACHVLRVVILTLGAQPLYRLLGIGAPRLA